MCVSNITNGQLGNMEFNIQTLVSQATDEKKNDYLTSCLQGASDADKHDVIAQAIDMFTDAEFITLLPALVPHITYLQSQEKGHSKGIFFRKKD